MTSGTTSIFPFAIGSTANVVTDSQWQALLQGGSLSTGFVQGLAQSAQVNKALRQTSIVSAGVAQFLADKGNNVNDSLTQQQIASMLQESIQDVISTSNVSGYIQAWNSSVANNGTGYPKYAVVADPNGSGALYMSLVDKNSTSPTPIGESNEWIFIPPSRIISVEAFGVVNDPSGSNSAENTAAFQNAVDAINEGYLNFALYIPFNYSLTLNGDFTFNKPSHLIFDGQITFQNSGKLTFNSSSTDVFSSGFITISAGSVVELQKKKRPSSQKRTCTPSVSVPPPFSSESIRKRLTL
jgi:hypothetical protein